MNLFCLLWMPLFYLFWRALSAGETTGGAWALILGSVAAAVHFFAGPFVEPGGFGLSRWLSGCVDIVVLPALVPVLFYLILVLFRLIRENIDFANFALLWLIPGALIRALGWSSLSEPVHLVLVPILWTSIAVGVSFFINLILSCGRIPVIVLASLGILIVPLAAASSYWAFFSQKTTMGAAFLAAAAVPMLISVVMRCVKGDA